MDVMWNDALQGVAPITGGQPLPPATYRLTPVAGEGKINSSQGLMLSLTFEVVSGPLKGRKAFHNENLPKGSTDQDKTRMGFFLGLMAAFGLTGEQLGQMFAGRPIDEASLSYLAQMLVQSGRVIKGTCSPQKNDETRINWRNWTPDDGIEPDPPKQLQNAAPQVGPPAGPNVLGGPPAGLPQGGFPQQGPPVTATAPGGFPQQGQMQQPQAPAAAQGLPLGGFPGSGGVQPNPAPDWATQQPVQGQAPQAQMQQPAPQQGFAQQPAPGPGQFAPAAQPQAASMNQFAQPGAAQFPLPGQQQPPDAPQPDPALQQGFPGQQFPGQVNPAAFPPAGAQPPQANI